MRNARYALALSALLIAAGASAQVVTPPAGQAPPPAAPAPPPATPTATKPVPYGPGMKVNLSPDGSKYLRFLLWTQIYARYNENNSGTLRGLTTLRQARWTLVSAAHAW
ncbi:hypothetical protein [Hymenobacter volaticus]|uniref:Uncharacterized protein n=1 Tax=Hymenobacter volaticus TaxID=2932254 RepID=A0ABY4GBP2_9BACT|nr:hypothetical protein [Hymenobacter volaticus]UOQ68167.1 hypothetical protein MUN86_10115 [Hymenobacter volaticus]